MLTIKQLQAFYWVARLGTLNKAAEKLHVTQSATTKRLQELEAEVTLPLFEGRGKKNMLTPAGRELVQECEQLLELLHEFDQLKGSAPQPVRTLHVGLTELSALTWFPTFLRRLREAYPAITVQPEIGQSSQLRQMISDARLDIAFVPDSAHDADERLTLVPICALEFGWLSAPGIFSDRTIYTYKDLTSQPFIQQTQDSIINELCAQLFDAVGAQPEVLSGGNNVLALAGLVSAGLGISCLPLHPFRQEIAEGRLQLLMTTPAAPKVTYACCFLRQPATGLAYQYATIARESSQQFFDLR